jgi:hypothetical protein
VATGVGFEVSFVEEVGRDESEGESHEEDLDRGDVVDEGGPPGEVSR